MCSLENRKDPHNTESNNLQAAAGVVVDIVVEHVKENYLENIAVADMIVEGKDEHFVVEDREGNSFGSAVGNAVVVVAAVASTGLVVVDSFFLVRNFSVSRTAKIILESIKTKVEYLRCYQ